TVGIDKKSTGRVDLSQCSGNRASIVRGAEPARMRRSPLTAGGRPTRLPARRSETGVTERITAKAGLETTRNAGPTGTAGHGSDRPAISGVVPCLEPSTLTSGRRALRRSCAEDGADRLSGRPGAGRAVWWW